MFRQLVAGKTARAGGEKIVEVDFSSPDSLRAAHRLLLGDESAPVGAIINLLPLDSQFRQRQGTSADEEAALAWPPGPSTSSKSSPTISD